MEWRRIQKYFHHVSFGEIDFWNWHFLGFSLLFFDLFAILGLYFVGFVVLVHWSVITIVVRTHGGVTNLRIFQKTCNFTSLANALLVIAYMNSQSVKCMQIFFSFMWVFCQRKYSSALFSTALQGVFSLTCVRCWRWPALLSNLVVLMGLFWFTLCLCAELFGVPPERGEACYLWLWEHAQGWRGQEGHDWGWFCWLSALHLHLKLCEVLWIELLAVFIELEEITSKQ